ncbi:MAG: cupin domain-containing protein [Acidobacteriota bacterium]
MTSVKLSVCLIGLVVLGACASTTPVSTPSTQSTGAETPELPDPLEAGWQGESVCEMLHDDEHQRVLRCTFPPGVGHERHYHARHFGYVLAGGQMRITDADGTREVDLSTGRSWASDGVEWHEVVNIGDSTSIYLIVEPK